MKIRYPTYAAIATSFALNFVAVPYAIDPMKEAARQATIVRLEAFADNLRGTSVDPEQDPTMPPKISLETLLKYNN